MDNGPRLRGSCFEPAGTEKTMTAACWVVGILAWTAAGAPAADAPAGADPGAREAIRELIRVTGGERLARLTAEQMIARFRQERPGVPADFWERFLAGVDTGELLDLMVPIYARHFTRAEIEELLAFYRTPLGRKLVAELPAITHESTMAGYEWGRRLGARAAAELEARGED